ncbi:hypothetical protein P3F89_16195 [Bacillus tropicus]|uniref:Uncharacterized protein n=1 Tax=Bacillus tropicus TaxID=2026188 RepID=A0ABD7ZK67_9BACI|nr:ABC-three component system protein [Bacillus tropicus]WMY13515.1 hypothetical protein P3F89_16195 [Bacillus tropicus]
MVGNFGDNSGVLADTINGNVTINTAMKKQIPSLLPKFIEVLAKQYTSGSSSNSIINNQPYGIEEKIDHNDIKLYRQKIEENYIYYHICEKSLESLRHIDENSKINILEDINGIYLDIKIEYLEKCGEYEDPYEELKKMVKKNSDSIINRVKNEIKRRIQNSYDGEQFNEQELNLCLNIFVCYALGECKILERPESNVDH